MTRRCAAGHDVPDALGEGDIENGAWLSSVQAEFIKQCADYERELDMVKGRDLAMGKSTYGDPLDADNIKALGFWAAHRHKYNLLYFPAVITLIKPATGMQIERVSSVAGRISSRFRSCMKAETLSNLLLAHEWLKEVTNKLDDSPRGLVDLHAWRVVVGIDEIEEMSWVDVDDA